MKNQNYIPGNIQQFTKIADAFPTMPESQFNSMVKRNEITTDKINSLAASLQRGKELVK